MIWNIKKTANKRRFFLHDLFELMKNDPYSARFQVSQELDGFGWAENVAPLKQAELTWLTDKELLNTKYYRRLLYRLYKTCVDEVYNRERKLIFEGVIL